MYCNLTIIVKHYADSLCLFKYQWECLNGESFTTEVGVKFLSNKVVLFFVPHVEMLWKQNFCDNVCFAK